MSVQLTINQFGGLTITLETCHTLSSKGFYISITLSNLNVRSLKKLRTGGKFKEIQNGNEMSRNPRLSMLSQPSIEHLAHFLFLLLLKYFSGDARKNIVIFYSERQLGLVRVFLITTAPSSSPVVDIFLVDRKCFCQRKTYPSFFHR